MKVSLMIKSIRAPVLPRPLPPYTAGPKCFSTRSGVRNSQSLAKFQVNLMDRNRTRGSGGNSGHGIRTYATQHSNMDQACCSTPPVNTAATYHPRGRYSDVGGLKTYQVGRSDQNSRIIVFVYDIFGFFPQTLQGADLLSMETGARVYMPDLLRDQPFPLKSFPPKTEQEQEALKTFFSSLGDINRRKRDVIAVVEELVNVRGAQKVGLVGFCWGGKLAIQSALSLSSSNNPITALAQVHPAMLSHTDVADLHRAKIPVASVMSKDEDPNEVKEWEKEIDRLRQGEEKVGGWGDTSWVKTYGNMHHGFAAARGDLTNQENLKAYEDVYSSLAKFFKETL